MNFSFINSSLSPAWCTPTENQKYVQQFEFPFLEDINKFIDRMKIGHGTFGEVYKARNKCTQQVVAMKKILIIDNEGFPISAIREINILKKLYHENVVRLIEICRSKASRENNFKADFYLIMEFCEHDLAALLFNRSVRFKLEEIKMMLKMLLNGLYYLHCNKILHRDLKPSNILLTRTGILKLADFGLARPFSTSTTNNPNCMTFRVVTLWYRAPELLLGETDYGPPIDMWSVGCIMAEFWIRQPLMPGDTEQRQLNLISRLCGSINPIVWPGVDKLPIYQNIKLSTTYGRRVHQRLYRSVRNAEAMNLLDQLFILDPSKRIDSNTALDHDFFWTDPMPCNLNVMMRQYNRSNFTLFMNR